MDLFEILMFGNYTSNANDEVPYELKMNLCFKIQSINMILVYNNRWQNKKLAKVYRNLNKEFNN